MHEIGDAGEMATLLARASAGDDRAWRELVDRHGSMVWGASRAYSANRADAEDVWQATWLLLAENLNRIQDPDALPGWLATTARRESLRLAKARRRESPAALDSILMDVPDTAEGPESTVLRTVAAGRLGQAFARLSQRCQQLLRVVAVAPDASYAQVSAALGMARGTIGPKKGRCLAALREGMVALGMPEEAAG
ncbi:RNA polymerase sigma factor [Haloactinomyces albus]|uniref:RNA polymerase sigma factor (Sigma-70 family) n=1 Tax=Haloactinomyces albus TaxID=1352928 RepID=A0AAE3ZEG6_9ACTN|nr:sigma-70 family RNA polymerase sigma factor [Haloactinomyces albus]MDR7302315.1 RNA polymerase sigma factor (sigma-70 family) [Haloactinomyces albus]